MLTGYFLVIFGLGDYLKALSIICSDFIYEFWKANPSYGKSVAALQGQPLLQTYAISCFFKLVGILFFLFQASLEVQVVGYSCRKEAAASRSQHKSSLKDVHIKHIQTHVI